jgi:hypothetical protein
MIQGLRNERRRLLERIEELEHASLDALLSNRPTVAGDPLPDPDDSMVALPPLLHYTRTPYRNHAPYKAVYEPIFARFQHSRIIEPMAEIAEVTGVQ